MGSGSEQMLNELYDKMKIREVVTNYCRGVDRMDRDLLMSVYHPDAIDDHGFFVGNREDFWDWVNRYHTNAQISHQHVITNHSCELDGDTAHAETYWMMAGMDAKDMTLTLGGGRYIDRMEKREGEWRIAARKCVAEWGGEPAPSKVPLEFMAMLRESGTVARDRSDSSYERPLAVKPERVGINLDILPPEYRPE
ncbi:nuclear transport factor 2 family protein [Novosphingobium sp. ERN07]|uniref:nuclear transport factor 2 family protein n=1 Tax=Novosphingobium sp. ERN07 TaxID=2726187 RepID=UPI001456991C|nr:nuclear transport factor 2 family protein [Novosphingobium sp. ERN07]NLR72784.1 nuclear transport factor 2 family protein [Novosphingobium sp. ERN07]